MNDGSGAAVRLAARRIGVQAAVLVAGVVLLLTGLAVGITVHTQNAANGRLLSAAAAHADDVLDAPAGTWLILRRDGRSAASAGLPAGLPDEAGFTAVHSGASSVQRELNLPAGQYSTLTRRHAGGMVQVVLDLGPSHRQLRELLLVLGVGALVGLALAGGIGALLARRVLAPLRSTMRLQQQFVADASHELRTPLTHLHTRVQLLRRALANGPAEWHAEADNVVRDSRALTDLVDDLLLASQPGAPSDVDDVPLQELLRETVDSVRPYATQRGITLHHEPPEEALTVRAAPVALRRALVALLDNAVEHTPPGGTIAVATHARGRRLELTIRDTGTGFDPADTAALTDRFHSGGQRADRRRYGLGLALVNDIAHRLGGTLHAHSTPGTGATFTLTLPTAGKGM